MTDKTVLSVDTNELVGMLTDVLRSAGKDATTPMIQGVMLHVDTHADGPVLVATATDRFTMGQAYIKASGTMRQLWLTRDSLAQLLPLLRPFARRQTQCDITVDGRQVTFSQNPLPGMANVSVTIESEQNPTFPEVNKFVTANGEPSTDVCTFAPAKLNVPIQVAVRRGENIRVVSYGANKPAWVYVGEWYRCLVMPVRASENTVSCPWFDVPNPKKAKVAA